MIGLNPKPKPNLGWIAYCIDLWVSVSFIKNASFPASFLYDSGSPGRVQPVGT
jgi:hypothetical protein